MSCTRLQLLKLSFSLNKITGAQNYFIKIKCDVLLPSWLVLVKVSSISRESKKESLDESRFQNALHILF